MKNHISNYQGEIATAISAISTILVCLYPPIGSKLTPQVITAITVLAALVPNIFLSNRKKRGEK